MSKERLLKILHEFHEDNNWLCYEFDRELNRLYLYENSHMVATFFLDDYELVMSNVIGVSMQSKKIVRVVVAKYITQEEALRNKKYKYKVPEFLCAGIQSYLARDLNYDHYVISFGILSADFQAHFTDEEIEERIEEHGEVFRKFIELCEKVEVE